MSDSSTPKPAAARMTDTARDKVRDTAAQAARRTADSIEGNPLSILVGGIAFGVLAGSLLPRTERETELLGPVGKKLAEGAGAAARAARDVGKVELVNAGISSTAAREQIQKLADNLVGVVKAAGDAAAKAAKPEK